jgi:membrane protein DedA with SNARE-associated domain/rhodanese-related sulfurtransferase
MDTDGLIRLLEVYGIPVLFANILLEQLGLPIPALPMMIVGGAVAAHGHYSPLSVFLVAVLACAIGDTTWYLIGKRYGPRCLRWMCSISLTPDYCVRQASLQFEKWGPWALAFGKFLPGVSAVAAPLAGVTRIPWPRFLLLTSLGSSLWAGLAVSGGAYFNRQVDELLYALQEFGTPALLVVLMLIIFYVAFKYWERRSFFKAMRMARITAEELRALIHRLEDPFIVDLRTQSERDSDQRSIPGAHAVALADIHRLKDQFPGDREIIFYCSCPNEASAATAARTLMNLGFRRVRPLLGGLEGWAAAGYEFEISTSTPASPLVTQNGSSFP